MTIKLKIMIMLGMFAVALIGFAGYESINSYMDYRQASDVEHMAEMAVVSSDLVHSLQIERGLTAGYLGSKGNAAKEAEFRAKLKERRNTTDDKLKTVQEVAKRFGHLPKSYEDMKNVALDRLEDLGTKRKQVDNFDIKLGKALEYYTLTNAKFLDGISIIGKYSDNADISSRVNAYASFLKSKERAGIERAVMTNVFARDAFTSDLYKKWIQRVTEQNAYMHEFKNYSLSLPENLAAYEKMEKNPQYKFDEVEAFRKTAQAKVGEGKFGVDPTLWFNTITAKINGLKSMEDTMAQDLIDTAKAQQLKALVIFFLLIAIALAVLTSIFVFGYLSSRSITKPLADLMKFMHVVTDGDLTIDVPVQKRKDEIAQSIQALGNLVLTLREILTSVSEASEQVTIKAAEIVTNSDQVAEGVNEQANQTNQISAAIQQMAMTSQEVTQQSSNATTSAVEAGNQAEEGANYVKDTVSGMSSIAQMVTTSAESVTELGQKSDEIGQIILMINDIADQTNLLALNAAIEAARAGEHGRGFAVVADEVRKLAERTSNATDQVGKAIESIQEGIKEAVSEMEQGSASVKEGVTLASTAGESLNVIVDGSREVAGLIENIAAAAREQSQAAQEISHNIESIAMINEQTNQGVQQSAEAAIQLKDSSDALQQRVKQFKLV